MIRRFRKVNDDLYRGSAPSVEDVILLKKKLGINKIVSLDESAGRHIDRACKLLGIEHIVCPIHTHGGRRAERISLLKFLKHDPRKLLLEGGPTYVHCIEGKDRTGLACAMVRCLYEGWTCDKALKEALRLGFGVGVPKYIVHLFKDVIQSACECSDTQKDKKHKHIDHNHKDMNSADTNGMYDTSYDIVSNQRDYPSDYRDYTLDGWEQQSWSPYEDYRVREFPFASAYPVYFPEQYGNRNNKDLDDSIIAKKDDDRYHGSAIPQSGTWDTSTDGIMGAGPSLVGSGYI